MRNISHKKPKQAKRSLSRYKLFLILAGSLLVGYLIGHHITPLPKETPAPLKTSGVEIKKILSASDPKEQDAWYLKLIKRVGPEEAQDDLEHSGIVFTGETHLLNHTVGNYIWKKYGAAGLSKCKDYFSSSCYHGFVLNAIGDGNVKNIDAIMKECKKQGLSNYAQCAHAVGHGFLAYVGYANLLEAINLCDQTKQRVPDFEVSYCHNGVFMENVFGLHEGKPSALRWIKADDILYPCDDPRLEERYLPQCWYNQALQLNNVLHGDFVRIANICDSVQGKDNKYMCFDGVFRGLHSRTQNDIARKFSSCRQMPTDWINHCIAIQTSASFQQGDRVLPFTICAMTKFGQKECYEELAKMIDYDHHNGEDTSKLCNRIPAEYRKINCRLTNG